MPGSDGSLLAPGRHLAVRAVIALSVVVVVGLGVRFASQTRAGGFDRAVDDWFVGHVNRRTALWFADLGNTLVVLVCTAAVIGFAAWLRSARAVLLAVLAPIASTSLCEYVIKPLVHRTKDGYLAYPSGHTTGWCTVTFVLVLLLLGPTGARLSRRTVRGVVAVAVALAVASMLGLVGSDYHYATDVIGGLGVAVGSVLALARLIDQVAAARSR